MGAEAAAQADFSQSRRASEEREEALRAEVTAFANRALELQSGGIAEGSKLEFPPTLTAEERRCVFIIAQDLGLSAFSRGVGDQRYITISMGHVAPDVAVDS